MLKFPDAPLDPKVQPWVRAVEKHLQEIAQRTAASDQKSGNVNKVQSGSLEVIAEALRTIEAQQTTILANQDEIIAQQKYLASLTISETRSGTGITSIAAGWTSDSGLRPSVTVRTTTGKLKIVVSATVSNAAATYSIAGEVDRDDMISGTRLVDTVYAGTATEVNGGCRQYVRTGLPINTDLTITAEVWGLAGGGAAGRVSISAEVVA